MNITEYQNYHEDKKHTLTEFPYNLYPCSIPLDFTFVPLHWHSELEIIVIKKGSGIISVDFHRQTVTSGDIIFILPGRLHSIEQDGQNSMEYENIILQPELLITGEQDLCAEQFIRPLMNNELPTETFFSPSLSYYAQLSECIRQLDLVCSLKEEGWQLAVKSCLFQFLFLLITNRTSSKSSVPIREKSLEKMKTILKYVEDHYSEHLTIEDMAELTFYSKSHFMKFFKSHIGTGFIEYLNDYRLVMAERLLRSSDSSVLEIASQSGFDNLSYFNRMFKRKYGISPGKYRKQA